MTTRYELDITITSAKNLKNINWRHGSLKPYAVVWIDPKNKHTTHVDELGDESPVWDEKLTIPFNDSIEDSTLYIDIVHANAAADTKPLIGSCKLKLKDVVNEVGMGNVFGKCLELKRPSGRPHGKLEVEVLVKEPRYRAPDPYYPPPYSVPVAPSQQNTAPPPYGGGYAYVVPPSGYPYAAPRPHYVPQYRQLGYGGAPSYGGPTPGPPSGVQPPYGGPPSGPPNVQSSYGGSLGGSSYGVQPSYCGPTPPYGGQPSYGGYQEGKKSKFGIGTGLAVGAAAGLLGGLAIAEGVDYVEDKIAEDVAEKVEDDLGYDVDDD